ncbi:Alpha/Beta hydrolase protein, partial [Dissophora ornata]
PRFWSELLKPFHTPKNYILYDNIPYFTPDEQLINIKADGWESVLEMALDIYRPDSVEAGDDRPVFVYIHGGAWTKGSKSWTGPLLTELISRKWVVVSVDYRLQSKAGYPTQLTDCKRALRWIKAEIKLFGGNPNNVIVGGDSAGGQLAAMLAMTPNEPEFQPGFEMIDTTVQGCVPQSAALDLTDSKNYSHHDARGRFIKEVARREGGESAENLKFLTDHSPMFRIKESGVPFLVVHGDLDNLTPVQTARDFAHKFQTQSKASMSYLEIPGGHHCFHVFSSPRSWYTVIGIAEWLSYNFDQHQKSPNEKKEKIHELVEWGWTI